MHARFMSVRQRILLNAASFLLSGVVCLILFHALIPPSVSEDGLFDILLASAFVASGPTLPLIYGPAFSVWWMSKYLWGVWIGILLVAFIGQFFSRKQILTYVAVIAIVLWWVSGAISAIAYAYAGV